MTIADGVRSYVLGSAGAHPARRSGLRPRCSCARAVAGMASSYRLILRFPCRSNFLHLKSVRVMSLSLTLATRPAPKGEGTVRRRVKSLRQPARTAPSPFREGAGERADRQDVSCRSGPCPRTRTTSAFHRTFAPADSVRDVAQKPVAGMASSYRLIPRLPCRSGPRPRPRTTSAFHRTFAPADSVRDVSAQKPVAGMAGSYRLIPRLPCRSGPHRRPRTTSAFHLTFAPADSVRDVSAQKPVAGMASSYS